MTAALLVAVLAVATRGLHLDGLMDVCDGLFGGYTPERRLEIMRDSHVGAFAVLGAVSLLLLKYGALVSLLSLDVPGKEWALVLFRAAGPVGYGVATGRIFLCAGGSGLGSPLHQGGGKVSTGGGCGDGRLRLRWWPAASAGCSSAGRERPLLAWLLGAGMARMLGGLTGDTYGATNEIVEVVTLIAAVALLPLGILEPLPSLLGGFDAWF